MRLPLWPIPLIPLLLLGCSPSQETAGMAPSVRFEIEASNAFFYYADLGRAADFYTSTLGL